MVSILLCRSPRWPCPVLAVPASRGGAGIAVTYLPCPPLQPHPVLSRSLSAFRTQPYLLGALAVTIAEIKKPLLSPEDGTRGDPENRGKVIPYLLQHLLNLLELME